MSKIISRTEVCLIPGGFGVTRKALLAKNARFSDAQILVESNDQSCMGTDICGLLLMGIAYGNLVTVSACGPDAEETLKSIVELFQNNDSNSLNQMKASPFLSAMGSVCA